jgi:hypothetical protein
LNNAEALSLEVSAHSDQSRWLIGTNMDIGIKGSNNEPLACGITLFFVLLNL